MNKTELIEYMARDADISKAAAGRALESLISTITARMKKGDAVNIIGFGSFASVKRAARVGRNPRTGADITIKACKAPKFTPSKLLKEAVN